MTPLILGLSGPELTADERAFFTEVDPVGYILFARNVVDRAQLRALTDALRAVAGREDVPILIDQEGGRVARMTPPVWPLFPPGEAFARLYDRAPISAIEAMLCNAEAIGSVLARSGSTSTACRCSTCGRRVPTTSSAIARSDRSRCRSQPSAARRSMV
jgi:beta-N-acetylhexosaminidase